MALGSLETRIKRSLYWDALRNSAFQYAIQHNDLPTEHLQLELKEAAANGAVGIAAADALHLLRRGVISAKDIPTYMTKAHETALPLYQQKLQNEKKRSTTGPIDWVKREAKESDLEVAIDGLVKRQIRWERLTTEASKTAPLRSRR